MVGASDADGMDLEFPTATGRNDPPYSIIRKCYYKGLSVNMFLSGAGRFANDPMGGLGVEMFSSQPTETGYTSERKNQIVYTCRNPIFFYATHIINTSIPYASNKIRICSTETPSVTSGRDISPITGRMLSI